MMKHKLIVLQSLCRLLFLIDSDHNYRFLWKLLVRQQTECVEGRVSIKDWIKFWPSPCIYLSRLYHLEVDGFFFTELKTPDLCCKKVDQLVFPQANVTTCVPTEICIFNGHQQVDESFRV